MNSETLAKSIRAALGGFNDQALPVVECVKNLAQAARTGGEVPDGWKLVPVEITDAMADASGCEGQYRLSAHEQAGRLWSAMLTAAPQPEHLDCGACPGDGSMCKTECRLLKESPTAGPGPFKMYVWCADCQASTSASIAQDLAQPPEGER